MTGETTTGLRARPLNESTWPDFAALVERHNGVWGGCWCMAFHTEGVGRSKTAAQNRSEKPDWRITFESHGFDRTRRLGKRHWVVAKVVR